MIVHRDQNNNVTWRGLGEPGEFKDQLCVEPGSFYERAANPWLHSELMKWGVSIPSLKMELGYGGNNDAFYTSLHRVLSGDEEARYVAGIRSVARRTPGTSLFRQEHHK